MTNKNLLLVLGLALVCVGFLKPNFLDLGPAKPSDTVVSVEVDKPSDPDLLSLAETLVLDIKKIGVSKDDCFRLAGVSFDISTLISLDGESETIKNTEEIRQANKLIASMLRMDINKKYPELASKMTTLVVGHIGDDLVPLNKELRAKSVNVFMALAWAFLEGTK